MYSILNDKKGFSIKLLQSHSEEYYLKSWDAIIHEMIRDNQIVIWGKVNHDAYFHFTSWVWPFFDKYSGATTETDEARLLVKER